MKTNKVRIEMMNKQTMLITGATGNIGEKEGI